MITRGRVKKYNHHDEEEDEEEEQQHYHQESAVPSARKRRRRTSPAADKDPTSKKKKTTMEKRDVTVKKPRGRRSKAAEGTEPEREQQVKHEREGDYGEEEEDKSRKLIFAKQRALLRTLAALTEGEKAEEQENEEAPKNENVGKSGDGRKRRGRPPSTNQQKERRKKLKKEDGEGGEKEKQRLPRASGTNGQPTAKEEDDNGPGLKVHAPSPPQDLYFSIKQAPSGGVVKFIVCIEKGGGHTLINGEWSPSLGGERKREGIASGTDLASPSFLIFINCTTSANSRERKREERRPSREPLWLPARQTTIPSRW